MKLALRPKSGRNPGREDGRDSMPMACWINGTFEILVPGSRGVECKPTRAPIVTEEDLAREVRAAMVDLRLPGSQVALVLSHAHVGLVSIEIPPVSEATAQLLVSREVERHKNFPGEAAWSMEPPGGGTVTRTRTVHYLPVELRDRLVKAFKSVGLLLSAILPYSQTVAQAAADGVPTGASRRLVVEAVAGSVNLVLVSQGRPVLHRQMVVDSEEPDRLAQEIRRTLLFAGQHLTLPVEEVGILGNPRLAEALQAHSILRGLAVRDESDPAQGSWREWICRSGGVSGANLVESRRHGESMGRSGSTRWVRILGPASLAGAIVLTLALEARGMSERAVQTRLKRDLVSASERVEAARRETTSHRQEEEVRRRWLGNQRSGLPGRLPELLGRALPETWVVTNLQVRGISNGWKVTVSGGVVSSSVAVRPEELQRVRHDLAREKLTSLDPIPQAGDAQGTPNSAGMVGWARRLGRPGNEARPGQTTFQLEGWMP